ncbi:MAG: dipeptide/oligopeptide/nickel ABC transporter ATP-binding protein, partial [Cyanobacteria bacterium P01_G01_bin.38]
MHQITPNQTSTTTVQPSPLLHVTNLTKHFPVAPGLTRWLPGQTHTQSQSLHAVDGIDLTIHPGESVGLVGES